MTRLFLLFNHSITPPQESDARASLGVSEIVPPPDDIKFLWCQIPPDLPEISDYLRPVRQWLKTSASPGDYVLIQGDFGACCLMVDFAFGQDLVPVYSTTHREMSEALDADGSIRLTHRFDHRIFRRYGF
jgi:hypothetical protein